MKSYDYIESDDLYDIALEWIKGKEYEKAINYLKDAIVLNPNFIYAYVKLALALSKMKRYGEAIKTLKKATRIDPQFDKLYFFMAKYAYKDGSLYHALKYLDMAMQVEERPLYLKSKNIVLKAIKDLNPKK